VRINDREKVPPFRGLSFGSRPRIFARFAARPGEWRTLRGRLWNAHSLESFCRGFLAVFRGASDVLVTISGADAHAFRNVHRRVENDLIVGIEPGAHFELRAIVHQHVEMPHLDLPSS